MTIDVLILISPFVLMWSQSRYERKMRRLRGRQWLKRILNK